MKYQPTKEQMQNTNDNIETPQELADAIFEYYYTGGFVLEPCCGLTNPFFKAFLKLKEKREPRQTDIMHCNDIRITTGLNYDFLTFEPSCFPYCYDWIITNPPWSKIREFLAQAMNRAKNVVFLCTLNHLFTKARINMIREKGFSIVDITTWDTPKSFPQSGFQLGTFHIRHNNEMPVDQFPVVHNGELRR